MKKIAILGSTGSIGTQTLDVVRANGDLEVVGISAGSNITLLEQQIREFHPKFAAVGDEAKAAELRDRVKDLPVKIGSGMDGMIELATMPESEILVTAIVGMIGIRPTVAAMKAGKDIALANKETLVAGGKLVTELVKKKGVLLTPIDSEHSAIFQCLQGCADRREIRRLILTCSGGPFYGMSYDEVGKMTKEDALRHPNWTMGPKITVDCATLMNKGLEVIEAMRLYRLPLSQVSVVIHRQSIVHSLVEYRDGAVLAQLGTPDMRLPIRYAMTYPERVESPAEPLDLLSCPPLTFAQPDRDAFPCLQLAEAAAAQGGTACAVLNGANEEAVGLFLAGRIGFHDIPRLVAEARAAVPAEQEPALEDILAADQAARQAVLDRA